MSTVTIEEAQAKLLELIDRLAPGEEVVITRNQQPVAKLMGQQRSVRKPRRPGSAKGETGHPHRGERASGRFQGIHAVRLLLDTHTCLWFLLNDPQLSTTARNCLVDPVNVIRTVDLAELLSLLRLQARGPAVTLAP
jgi:prevent-host-death family protein